MQTYATATRGGEMVSGTGTEWPFLRYFGSPYRVANCIGVRKGDAWEGVSEVEKNLTTLPNNGRSQYRKYPVE